MCRCPFLLLVRRLTQKTIVGYNYTTFDVIGDLAFGEAFGCLETSQYHPWVSMIFQSFKLGTWLQTASFFPWFKLAIFATIPKGLREKREEHMRLTKKKLSRRMELGAERPDFIESLLRTKDGLEMDLTQLQANSSVLIVAGSETTATLLSGVTYLLATNADALAKLTEEVRATFKNEGDIDYLSVSSLPYMLACLDEALRLYPPAPLGIPRVVPEGGGHVAGHSVAKGVSLSPPPSSFPPYFTQVGRHHCVPPYLAQLTSKLPCRRWCRCSTTPCITVTSSSPCRMSTTPSAGWGIRDSPTMTETSSSRSMSGQGIALDETWRILKCVSSWRECCGILT